MKICINCRSKAILERRPFGRRKNACVYVGQMYSIVILFRQIDINIAFNSRQTPNFACNFASMPTTRTPFIGRLYFIYQSIGQIISFQMMPPPRSFDDLDGKERGQKKTDDLRTMTTLGPRTLLLHTVKQMPSTPQPTYS